MLISSKRKFIFIHIYKTAGTSMVRALEPFAYSRKEYVARRISKRINSLKKRLNIYKPPEVMNSFENLTAAELMNKSKLPPGHIKASELVNIIGMDQFKSYYTFAFIRNPWDWLVSQYIYMLRMTNHHNHDLIKGFGSFDAFIRWKCSNDVVLQKNFVCSADGELLLDFVGTFENLEEDFKTICSRIGISVSLPRYNISRREPYRQYYSEETRDLVMDVYKEDIRYFNYEF